MRKTERKMFVGETIFGYVKFEKPVKISKMRHEADN